MSVSGPSGFRRRSKIDPKYEIELDDKTPQVIITGDNASDFSVGQVTENADALQRRLSNRQIQLIAIGGSIGR